MGDLLPVGLERPWLLLALPVVLLLLGLLARRSRADLEGARRQTSLALRAMVALLLCLALAGLTLRRRNPALSVVFVVDASRSIPPAEVARAKAFVTEAVGTMKGSDRAGIVMFGGDALLERMPTARHDGGNAPPLFDARPDPHGSDLQAALELGVGAMPADTERRVVLMSDGLENAGSVVDAAHGTRASGSTVSVVPLGGAEAVKDVYVDALQAPPSVKEGETFDLRVVLRATDELQAPARTVLRVYRDRTFLGQQEVEVASGKPVVLRALQTLSEGGFYRYRAEISVPEEARGVVENDVGHAFVNVEGKPRVLLAAGSPEDGAALEAALRGQGVPVTAVGPGGIPTTLEGLAGYRCLVLANVSALHLSGPQAEAIRTYVRDLGGGLLMTGGEHGFGPGGYYRTPVEEALPVDMDVKNRKYFPTIAMALVIDKSGSMGSMDDRTSKMALAREAGALTVSLLTASDEVTVIAFDSAAQVVVPLHKVTNRAKVIADIGTIRQGGGTDIYPGLKAAYDSLKASQAGTKHVILLSDGMSAPGDYPGLTRSMRAARITVSTLAIGDDSDLATMEEIAKLGDGRFYVVKDIHNIPKIFTKETILASRSFLVEETFQPVPVRASEILKGIDLSQAPRLHGYAATTAKDRAEVLLKTHRGDPLLATWRFGLGKAAAFTSDTRPRWSRDWLPWEGSGKLWGQVARWTVSTLADDGIHLRPSLERGELDVVAEVTDGAGKRLNFLDVRARVVRPGGEVEEMPLGQVGPGRYAGRTPARTPGTYFVAATAEQEGTVVGQRLSGASLSYPVEFRTSGRDVALLRRVAEATGGKVLEEPRESFVHDQVRHPLRIPLWRTLATLGLLLFLLDVAVRRVMLPDAFYERLLLPFRALARAGRAATPSHLASLRDRVTVARARTAPGTPPGTPPGTAAPASGPPSPAAPAPAPAPAPTPAAPEEAAAGGERPFSARLLDAKKRAQKP